MPTVRRTAQALAALLFVLFSAGCRPRPAASGGASAIVDNLYPGTCSAHQTKPAAITAAMDRGPAVGVADNAKFQFANLAPGGHTLTLRSSGVAFEGGSAVNVRAFTLAQGAGAKFEITCAPDGLVNVSGPGAF